MTTWSEIQIESKPSASAVCARAPMAAGSAAAPLVGKLQPTGSDWGIGPGYAPRGARDYRYGGSGAEPPFKHGRVGWERAPRPQASTNASSNRLLAVCPGTRSSG